MVRAVREGEGYCITQVAEETLPFSPFSNSIPSKEHCTAFNQAIAKLVLVIPQDYWPLQIALPDPAAIVQVMQFDSLPPTAHERESIAKFRLEKEFPALTQMQCTTQDISKIDKPGLLFATFIQRSWLDCIRESCRSAGLVPSVIDISICHLFNRFHDVVMATSDDGVLISVEQGSWSILFWDGDHRPRFVRSRWLDISTGKDEEYELIAQDVERLIMSYVMRVNRRKVSGIYICADEEDRVSLANLLDKRMKIPCVQLDVTGRVSAMQGVSLMDIPMGAIAAIMPRL
jgi:hypothetical protein